MRLLCRIAMAALLLTAALTCAAAQSAAQPAARYHIAGRVVNAVSGEPLPHCQVSIGNVGNFETALARQLTGNDGSFDFAGLEARKYWLNAEHTGFRLQSFEQHGDYSSAIAVGPGLDSAHLRFRLHPDAVISGTITDDENEAVANASVWIYRSEARAGFRQLLRVAELMTDDRGFYRTTALEEGRYSIVASARPWFSEMNWNSRPMQCEGTVCRDPEPSRAERSLFDVTYPLTYYPGATDSAEAASIQLHAGESYTANFNLLPVPTYRLSVHHAGSTGGPQGLVLWEKVFGYPLRLPSQTERRTQDTAELRGVPPGNYSLDVIHYGAHAATYTLPVNLRGDMDADASAAQPPVLHGSIDKKSAGSAPRNFVRLWKLHSSDFVDAPLQNDEFSFPYGSLPPGDYAFYVMGGINSTVARLTATGAEVNGQSLRLTGSGPVELKVELCRATASVTGVVRRDGHPVAGAMLVLVPQWPEWNLPLFRRDQSDSDGSFTLQDVVPGRYRILALDHAWDAEWAELAMRKVVQETLELDVVAGSTAQLDVSLR
jgi:hypothetical protein